MEDLQDEEKKIDFLKKTLKSNKKILPWALIQIEEYEIEKFQKNENYLRQKISDILQSLIFWKDAPFSLKNLPASLKHLHGKIL
jgi:hypothetical protein